MKKLISLIIIFSFLLVPFNIYADESVNLIVLTDKSFDMESFEAKGYGEITNVYKEIFSGFSIETYEKYIDAIKAFDGVSEVFEDKIYKTPEIMPSKEVFSFFSEQTGYLGEGAVIAVIDSSFNVSHEVFKLSEGTEIKYKIEDIASILSKKDMQAEATYNKTLSNGDEQILTEDLLYKSDKIPFAFDYAGNDTGVYSSAYHGNAVASIVGGNSSSCKGVLPEAQLVLMKVGDDAGNISESSIYAAFEDALHLGVDAVNLSMGATAGFSDGRLSGYPIGNAISILNNAGIIVSVAAGNDGIIDAEGLSKYKNKGSYPYVITTDYGLISTPASAPSAVAVAAADFSTGGIASFSSWGVTPDLLLKPDITSKGTGWYVATVNGYGKEGAGTSFASPDACARTVIIKKELEGRGYTGGTLVDYTKKLMINTADILRQSDDVCISPRAQGAGYINEQRAASAKAVMYAADGSNALNLKDKLTDNFEISFKIENLSGEALTYTPSLELITDGYKNGRITGKSVNIPHTVRFSENEITLLSGEIKTVKATVDIDDTWLSDNSSVFTNGFYLEGYIKMNEELNIPFMGYYGNWLASPSFIPCNINNGFGIANIINNKLFFLGNNYYKVTEAKRTADPMKIAVSPNGDGKADIAEIFTGLYRNLSLLYWEIQDENSIEIYSYGISYMPKSVGTNYLGYYPLCWTGINNNKEKVADGQYYLYAAAVLDYEGKNIPLISDEVRIPVYVDTQFPEIEGYAVREENGRKLLDIYISDNHYIQGAAAYDNSGVLINKDADLENNIATIDITGNGFIDIEAMDYAFNKVAGNITIADEYIVYFDSSDMISRIETTKNNIYKSGHNFDYSGLSLKEGEEYAKVFVWTENLEPVYYFIKEK